MWLKAELKEAAAAITLLEETVASLESTLEEKTEEWQAALEYLEDACKNDKARLEEQLSALSAEKVPSILQASCGGGSCQRLLPFHSGCQPEHWKTKHGH